MKILALEVEGFGPFRDRQTVSLADAATGGILLISGRTGSGKSSLLDAVSFALFGAVPRYGGQTHRVRSDHLESTKNTNVQLDFEIGDARYRVQRQPDWERPKRRGEGTTMQKQEARLWVWNEIANEWDGRASRPTDVAAELHQILGMNHSQFLQVVMLAQGGFQKFLHADDKDRQATLRSLFHTERFDAVERLLVERRRLKNESVQQAEAALRSEFEQIEAALRETETKQETESEAKARATIRAETDTRTDTETGTETETDGKADSKAKTLSAVAAEAESEVEAGEISLARRSDAVARSLESLDQQVTDRQAAVQAASEAQQSADMQVQETRRVARNQERRAAAQAQQAQLDGQRAEINKNRVQLEAAARALSVAPTLTRRALSRETLESHDAQLEAANSALQDARPSAVRPESSEEPTQQAASVTERDALASSVARLTDAEGIETQLVDATANLTAQTAAEQAARAAVRNIAARAEALPKLVLDARQLLASTRDTAQKLAESEHMLARAESVSAAAAQTLTLAEQLREAVTHSARAANAATAASASLRDLLEQRLHGMAGELAADLEPGSPCAVCGATEHPAPARNEDSVSRERIEEAEIAEREARETRDEALAAEREIEARHTTAVTQANGQDVSAANEQVELSQAAVSQAREAARVLDEHTEQVAELEREQAQLTEAQLQATQELTLAKTLVEHTRRECESLQEKVEQLRAGHPSISVRIEAEQRVLHAIAAVLELAALRLGLTEARETAEKECLAALSEHDFADEVAVAAASLTAQQQEVLRQRVTGFDTAVQQNAGVLGEADLANLPGEPVPLAAHEAEYAAAQAAASAAAIELVNAQHTLRNGRQRLAKIDRDLAALGDDAEQLLTLRRLVDTVQGKDPNTKRMRLESFLLAARLEAIISAANVRLDQMVGGRYLLEHDDALRSHGRQSGLGVRVMDAYTGRSRSAASLSGGETFLASLALALGLADVVSAEAGGISLDTLFVDEGFGSLDPDALDQAMATLDGLREGGRTVVLISHVAEMKERIGSQLEVVVDGRGTSHLRGAGVQPSGSTERELEETRNT